MMLRTIAALIGGGLIAFTVGTLPVFAAFTVPPNDGFVTQSMTEPGAQNILSSEEEHAIESTLSSYGRSTGHEIAVFITDSLKGEPIENVSNSIFRSWGVGKAETNDGILIVVAAADQQARIEVGYGLEGDVPDIVASGILQKDMRAHFQNGEYAAGIAAGIDALMKHIGGEYTPDRYDQASSDSGSWAFFFGVLLFQMFASYLASTKSWWLGGVIGGVFGLVLAIVYSWWVSIPLLVVIGLFIDFILSRIGPGIRRGRGIYFGGGFGSGGGGSGFGGFGGGSSGGGGASMRW
jgi:uncharacterized protein